MIIQYIDRTLLIFSLTVCPISSDPFDKVSYYIKWVNNSWPDGMKTTLSVTELRDFSPFFSKKRDQN